MKHLKTFESYAAVASSTYGGLTEQELKSIGLTPESYQEIVDEVMANPKVQNLLSDIDESEAQTMIAELEENAKKLISMPHQAPAQSQYERRNYSRYRRIAESQDDSKSRAAKIGEGLQIGSVIGVMGATGVSTIAYAIQIAVFAGGAYTAAGAMTAVMLPVLGSIVAAGVIGGLLYGMFRK
jgi:hypothetical protein